MRIALVILSGVLFCACGRTADKQEPEKTTVPATLTPDSVSDGVIQATERPLPSEEEAFSAAENLVREMTLEEKAGQMFLVDMLQLDDTRTRDGNVYRATKKGKQSLKKYHIGGVYLSANNIKNIKQAKNLVADLKESVSGGALYVAVEEEGGGEHSLSAKVPELKDTGYITQSEMGKNMTEQQAYQTGKTIAGELAGIGINLNLAPVSDLASEINPEYALRCFGKETDKVSEMLRGIVPGMRENGIAVTLKYFPGIGNVPGETTEEILENSDSLMALRKNNFSVYSEGIKAGADCVMVSNVSVNKVTMKKIPAFMSGDIVTSLLREEMDFDGIIMTPPLNDNVIRNKYTAGFAVTEAIKAGCDMLVLPGNLPESYQAVIEAVRTGQIDEKVINTAVRRILQNKILRGILVLEQ